jgi:tetratricopeptide (TPR) repeat protein
MKTRCSLPYALCFLLIGILLYFPLKMLIADYYHNRVAYILDDKSTEYLDTKGISGDTISDYNDAINSLKKASAIVPSKSIYPKGLSDIYSMLGRWAESMDAVAEPLPAGAVSAKEAFENSARYLKKAVYLEPANPDYHLALGELYDRNNRDAGLAEKEFAKAVAAAPVNAALRYVIAMHYLLAGRKGEALEQARILAKIDDSYQTPPEDIRRKAMSEKMAPAYLSQLYNSYLFGALELAWRISKDKEVIKGIAPDNPDAKMTVQLFFEWKGIEE